MPACQKHVYVPQTSDRYCKAVADYRQGGTLADTHEGKPGLPRGRSRLPVRAVQASQRERLIRAIVAAVAPSGYAPVTVADIVRRARVSPAAFYTHFTDKGDCLLAATQEGGKLMVGAPDRYPGAAPRDAGRGVLRVGVRAFLAFVAGEPEFSKIFYVDMPAAGPRAWERLEAAQHQYAVLNQTWHERARDRHPDWPAVPYEAYLALAGAMAELVRARVRRGETETLPAMEDTLVSLHLAVWPAAAGNAPARRSRATPPAPDGRHRLCGPRGHLQQPAQAEPMARAGIRYRPCRIPLQSRRIQ